MDDYVVRLDRTIWLRLIRDGWEGVNSREEATVFGTKERAERAASGVLWFDATVEVY